MRALPARRFTPTRPLAAVPPAVRALLVLALALQLSWQAFVPGPTARAQALPAPPPESVLRLAALGEPATLAATGLLWLQFHDDQPGVSLPFRSLDYGRLRAWLSHWLALAPDSEYPLLLATHVYAQVADPARQRIMLDFVHSAFLQRPGTRWRWLAEAGILARHRLEDPELALHYARAIAVHTRPGQIPHWARDLQILYLEANGEFEAARVLVGGLLASGEIDDPHELRFLERRLERLERRTGTEAGP